MSRQCALVILVAICAGLFVPPAHSDTAEELASKERLRARLQLAQLHIPYTHKSFLERASEGDADAIRLFLLAGMDVNVAGPSNKRRDDKDAYTALEQAVLGGEPVVVRLLLAYGADPKTAVGLAMQIEHYVPRTTGHTEIQDILQNTEGDSTRRMVDLQPDPKRLEARFQLAQLEIPYTRDEFYARVKEGDVEALNLLFWAGMSPNRCGNDGNRFVEENPLRVAIKAERINIVRLLLAVGANPNACDVDALWTAAQAGRIDILRVMQEKGVDILRSSALAGAVNGHEPDTVHYLLAQGADMNATHDGMTPLGRAARDSKRDMVELLLKAGANPNIADDYGRSPLMQAIDGGKVDNAELLLNLGVDVNARDQEDGTALMYAVYERKADIVRALVEKGAAVDARGKPALRNGMEPGGTALMLAAKSGQEEIAQYLLQHGADPNARTPKGKTVLMSAAYAHRKWETMVDLLVANGAKVNVADPDTGVTLLMRAAEEGSLKTVQTLLAHGAEVNATDKDGETALMDAAYEGHIDIAEALLDKGADVNVTDKEGGTALMRAAYKGHVDIAEELLDRGADVNMQGKPANLPGLNIKTMGNTALLQAQRQHHKEMVDLLLSHGAK